MNRLAMTVLIGSLLVGAVGGCDDERRDDVEPCSWECAEGSRYPCPCTAESGCSDGATCGALTPTDPYGFCARACETDATCETTIDCPGVGKCIASLFVSAENHCAFVCGDDGDCPSNMECIDASGHQICYPF
jgi:hypothetical protein